MLDSLNAHNLPISLPILVIVSKFMVHRALIKKYLSLGLLSPLWSAPFFTNSEKQTLWHEFGLDTRRPVYTVH